MRKTYAIKPGQNRSIYLYSISCFCIPNSAKPKKLVFVPFLSQFKTKDQ